jgi:hypothetical protein
MSRAALALNALLGLSLATVARDARADCTPGNAFASASRAARVLVVRAGRNRASLAFVQQLTVERALLGSVTPRSIVARTNPLSGDSFVAGQRYVVFFSAQGQLEGGCSAVALDDPAARGITDSLSDWIAARTDAVRVSVLVRAIAAGARKPATDAAQWLASNPALLAAVDGPSRASLVAAIPVAHDERAYGIAWALGRLHAIESLPAWIAWLGVAHNGANARPVQDALELMTNRHDPAYTRGRDFGAQEQSALRQRWSQWESAHRGETPATFLAAGFRERGVAPVALGDRAQVAAALSRTADDALSLQVVTNACELGARSTASLMASTFVSIDVSRALAACAGPSSPK